MLLAGTAVLQVVHVVADVSIGVSVAVLGAASALYVITSLRPLSRRWVLVALLVVCAAGISQEPDGTDLWIYQAYGRLVVEHHADPYEAVPADFPDDPVMQRVGSIYQDTPSAYGPAFVGVSVLIAAVTGTSELAGRLAWQLIGLAAVLGCVALLWRRGVSGRALAAFALNPIVGYQLVHLAHNDALVALALLAGCLLASDDRTTWAAIAFAAAALVKAPAGVALVVLGVWLLSNRRTVEAARALLVAAGIGVAAIALGGGVHVLSPMLGSRGQSNATNIWNAVRGDWETFVWRPLRGIPETAGPLVSTLAIGIPLALAVWAAYRFRDRPVHEPVTVGVFAVLLLALYPSAWYYAWILPLLAVWARRERVLLGAQTALYQLTTQAWLIPVAALITGDGRLGFADRLPAPLLGLCSLTGLALLAYLIAVGPRRAAVDARA